jgi:hypothetical protein
MPDLLSVFMNLKTTKLYHCDLLPNVDWSEIRKVCLKYNLIYVTYNWINQLSNTTTWWLDICCLLHRYQLHVLALMAIFRLID